MKQVLALRTLFLLVLNSGFAAGQPGSALQGGPICPPFCGYQTYTFQTNGRQLLDPCGSAVVLKGVNKMAVFDYIDPVGATYFHEIAKTGANCVRIAWEMKSKVNGTMRVNPLSRLDQLITNAKNQKLIPIVGLWDFTGLDDGGFSRLNEYVTYWTTPAMLALIQKHRAYLIVNIGNEAAKSAEPGHGGNEDIAADLDTFATGYKKAIVQLRRKGVTVPLMIDGMDRGKSLHCFAVKGAEIKRADSLTNLIFSFHAYWPKWATDADSGFIQAKFNEVSTLNTPIVIGELSKYGVGSETVNPCSAAGIVDYEQFAQRADSAGMGWLLWEWGPGNQWKVAGDCPQMDMTTTGSYASLGTTPNNDWARNLAISARYSIKNTALKTYFIKSGFKTCPLQP